jgi:TonB family protein
MAIFLLPVATGLWQVRRLRRSAQPWRHGQAAADRLALEAGICRRVEVLLHDALAGPMTCGAAHPAIALPRDAQTWEGEDLNRALVHELEHVRRRDWVAHCMARAVCAAYWFHPLVWMAWRQLALEAERSCDDAVLGRSEATAYADQLVGLARRLATAAKSPALAMANHADLSTRVGALLDGRQRRGRAGKFAVLAACAVAAALVVTMAPLRVVAAQQSASPGVGLKTNARFVSATGLVIETVTVSDSNGKALEGLGANDFVLTEDDAPQTIGVFEFQKLDAAQAPISSYYILGYYSGNQTVDGLFRRIKIACKDAAAKLDYRLGYYANKRFTNFNGSVSGGAASSVAEPNAAPGVTPPRLINKVEPAYSPEARKAKYQGQVVLSVEVDASGQVTDVKANRSLGLGLDGKAIDAVKQWKFTPGMQDGKPVAMQVEVEVDFRLL